MYSGKTPPLLPFTFLLCCCLKFLICTSSKTTTNTNVTSTNAFSLELIHMDHISSPFYNASLSDHQRYQRLHDFSDKRMQWLEESSAGNIITPNQLEVNPRSKYAEYGYATHTVLVGIGFPPVNNHLSLETGIGYIWINCRPCFRCPVRNVDTLFDPSKSRTYRGVRCNDDLCQRLKKSNNNVHSICEAGMCQASTGSYSVGSIAKERLSTPFQAGTGGKTLGYINDITIVCADNPQDNLSGVASGVFGLGFGDMSFPFQTSLSFSYCLSSNKKRPTLLRFHRDERRPIQMAFTPLFRRRSDSLYYLNLVDIGVLGRRFWLPSLALGRTAIDPGFSYSHLPRSAYDVVKEYMLDYFRRQGYTEAPAQVRQQMRFELCYNQRKRDSLWNHQMKNNLPTMELYFPTSTLKIQGKNMFVFNSAARVFCLALKSSSSFTVIGNYQQQDTRFVYNINRKVLEFQADDCSRD